MPLLAKGEWHGVRKPSSEAALSVPADSTALLRPERRFAAWLAYARCATAALQFVPLLYSYWFRLSWLALAAAIAAAVQGCWLLRWVRARRRVNDPVLIGADVLFCTCLIAANVAAARPDDLSHVLTAVFPYVLVGVGFVGSGLTRTWYGPLAFAALATMWAAAATTAGAPQLISDLTAIVLIYLITMFIAGQFHDMPQLVEAVVRNHDLVAEEIRKTDLAREREHAYREIHGHLLPIVDAVAAGTDATARWTALAIREAARARRLIVDGQAAVGVGFEILLFDVRDTFADTGLAVTSAFHLEADPPAEVGEVVAAAAREALTNVLKHAGHCCKVYLYAASAQDRAEVIVCDNGRGFDPAVTSAGNGFTRTYEAVRSRGGAVDVRSSPDNGTSVRILWPAPAPGSAL